MSSISYSYFILNYGSLYEVHLRVQMLNVVQLAVGLLEFSVPGELTMINQQECIQSWLILWPETDH